MMTLEKLAEDLRPVFKRHGVLQAIVFGSYATGSASRLIYTPEELEQLRDRPFVRRILSEGHTIYEC